MRDNKVNFYRRSLIAICVSFTGLIWSAFGNAQAQPSASSATEPPAAVAGPAADVPAPSEPLVPDDNIKRYLVEMIIIKNVSVPDQGSEIWDKFSVTRAPLTGAPLDPMQPSTDTAIPPLPAANETIATPAAHELPLDVIPTELDEMAKFYRVLRVDPQYHVLKHLAWLQPVAGKKTAAVIDVTRLPDAAIAAAAGTTDVTPAVLPAQTTDRVSGTVRIYEHQLLFVETDLTLHAENPITSTTDPASSSYAPPVPRLTSFKIKEKRRIKLNQINYIDHPFFGVLIRVSRWGETEEKKPPS